jgi:hypothetical protein
MGKMVAGRCCGAMAAVVLLMVTLSMLPARPSGAQTAAKTTWVKDATRAPLPQHKVVGRLAGSPFTVHQVLWRRETALAFSDAPVDVMVLELRGRMANAPKLPPLPPGVKAPKAAQAREATFLVRVSVRQKATLAGKRLVHRLTDPPAAPEAATPEKPVLVGAEVSQGALGTMMAPYTLRLEFGARRGSVQPGAIYLCLEDGDKSFVAGTFDATVK